MTGSSKGDFPGFRSAVGWGPFTDLRPRAEGGVGGGGNPQGFVAGEILMSGAGAIAQLHAVDEGGPVVVEPDDPFHGLAVIAVAEGEGFGIARIGFEETIVFQKRGGIDEMAAENGGGDVHGLLVKAVTGRRNGFEGADAEAAGGRSVLSAEPGEAQVAGFNGFRKDEGLLAGPRIECVFENDGPFLAVEAGLDLEILEPVIVPTLDVVHGVQGETGDGLGLVSGEFDAEGFVQLRSEAGAGPHHATK